MGLSHCWRDYVPDSLGAWNWSLVWSLVITSPCEIVGKSQSVGALSESLHDRPLAVTADCDLITNKGNEMKIQGPIEVELKVSLTNGEGVDCVATIGLGIGIYPSEEKMRDAVAKFESESMPDGFRLMTKREWWDMVCPPNYEEYEDGERHAVRFAIPGGNEFDA